MNGANVVENYVDFPPEPDLEFPSLEKLDLRRADIGFCELRVLAAMKCPLKELLLGCDFEGSFCYFFNETHEVGIERTLEKLTLDKCKIDKRTLLNIASHCQKLKFVHLKNCIGISGATVRNLTVELQKSNPKCKVIYE